MKTKLLCKVCGKTRILGQLKCKKCSVKAFNKKQREQVRKEKKKEKKANSPKRLKTLCDKLWREKAIEWFGNKCVICGSEKINLHHIISRNNRAVRWYVPNAVPLCPLHHTFGNFSAHHNPLAFRQAMIDLRGLKWEQDLIKKANEVWDKKYVIIEE